MNLAQGSAVRSRDETNKKFESKSREEKNRKKGRGLVKSRVAGANIGSRENNIKEPPDALRFAANLNPTHLQGFLLSPPPSTSRHPKYLILTTTIVLHLVSGLSFPLISSPWSPRQSRFSLSPLLAGSHRDNFPSRTSPFESPDVLGLILSRVLQSTAVGILSHLV